MSYNYTDPLAYTQAPNDMTVIRPAWLEDLTTFYEGRIARQFVLHFNITDFVIDTTEKYDKGKGEYERRGEVIGTFDQPFTFREYLYQFLFNALQCQAIFTYSLAEGVLAQDPLTFQATLARVVGTGAPAQRQVPPQSQWSAQGQASYSSSTQTDNVSTTNEYSAQAGVSGQGPARSGARQNRASQMLQDAARRLKIATQPGRQQVQAEEGREVDISDNTAEAFKVLGHLLRQPYYAPDPPPVQGAARPETPVAVILDYAEKLIPYHLGEGQGDREQLQALEVVQRWAIDPLIRKTRNIIILLTTNIGLIPSSVYAEGSGCRAIRVPLPTEGERSAYIYFAMTCGRPRLVQLDSAFGNSQGEQARQLSRATQGMRLTDIDNLSRRVIVEFRKRKRDNPNITLSGPLLRMDDVQRAKAEVVKAQSAQLLEIVPPVRGFNEIGGLDNLKQYLGKRTALMVRQEFSPLVPSGLLLAGPPGTGKTIIAEALATESGFNLVKMRNIQDKWVGSSERNLELVINLLKDLYPVVVFIDEIDQAMARRDTGQSGDSGVGARMFARILEEMSNASNRGRILWVAATNRADILDAALLRRFDRVVPLLTPDVHESCRIFATMLSTITKQSGNNIQVAYGGDLGQTGTRDKSGRPNPTQGDLDKFLDVARITSEIGLTGASIEIIVRRAIEMAYEEKFDAQDTRAGAEIMSRHLRAAISDFKPNYNRLTYEHQSLLALRSCNFYSVIPTLPKTGVYGLIQDEDGHIDDQKLEAVIQDIERQIGISG